MTDTVTPQQRSWIMSRIRSANTKPELLMRSLLHRCGFRYSLSRHLPGRPDIALPRYRAVVLVHGCFWHWHRKGRCKIAKLPKSNRSFWLRKLKSNVARDRKVALALRSLGWCVHIVWECEVLSSPERVLKRVVDRLQQGYGTPRRLASRADVGAAVVATGSWHRRMLDAHQGDGAR